MTTIAFKDGVLAADSQVSGVLAAACGDSGEVACQFDVYSAGPVQALSLRRADPLSGVRE